MKRNDPRSDLDRTDHIPEVPRVRRIDRESWGRPRRPAKAAVPDLGRTRRSNK